MYGKVLWYKCGDARVLGTGLVGWHTGIAPYGYVGACYLAAALTASEKGRAGELEAPSGGRGLC